MSFIRNSNTIYAVFNLMTRKTGVLIASTKLKKKKKGSNFHPNTNVLPINFTINFKLNSCIVTRACFSHAVM